MSIPTLLVNFCINSWNLLCGKSANIPKSVLIPTYFKFFLDMYNSISNFQKTMSPFMLLEPVATYMLHHVCVCILGKYSSNFDTPIRIVTKLNKFQKLDLQSVQNNLLCRLLILLLMGLFFKSYLILNYPFEFLTFKIHAGVDAKRINFCIKIVSTWK